MYADFQVLYCAVSLWTQKKSSNEQKKLSKIGFLAVCMKGKTLIHTSGYPNLYTAEVELYNLSHICY